MLFLYRDLDFEWAAILRPSCGSAHCHDSTGIIVPSCCHRGDYFCNYDPYGGPSTHEGFYLKNHDRTLRRPTEGSSMLDFGNQFFSFPWFITELHGWAHRLTARQCRQSLCSDLFGLSLNY